MNARIVIQRAHCDEVVEIRWTLPDGTTFIEHRTCPPKEVREARQKEWNLDAMDDDAHGL